MYPSLENKHVLKDWRPLPKGRNGNKLVCVLTEGFSEIPLIEQATFSIWENEAAMEDFAYRSVHQDVIRTKRKYGDFSEEMYTCWQPLETRGTWEGTDPLKPTMMKLTEVTG